MVNVVNLWANDLFYNLRTSFFTEREQTNNFTKECKKKYKNVVNDLSEIYKKLKHTNILKEQYDKILQDLQNIKKIVFVYFMDVWKTKQLIAVKKKEPFNSFLPSIMQDFIEQMFDILEIVKTQIESLDAIEQERFKQEIETFNIEMLKNSFIIEVQPTQICRTTPK